MTAAKKFMIRLLGSAMVFSLLAGSLARGDELLRYSQDDPTIKGFLEGVGGTPGGYGVRVAENITGKWVPLRRDARLSAAKFSENTNVTWKTLLFTNGLIEISYQLEKETKERKFVGRYQIIHKATEGRGNAPNILIRSRDADDSNITVLVGARIGVFNCFRDDLPVLWFCDPDGLNYFFEPVGLAPEELFKRMGFASADEVQRNKKAMEERRLKSARTTDSELTKEAIANLQSGKLSDPERNKEILRLMNEGDATCVPVLLDHLKANHSLVVRQNAIRALGKTGDKRAVSPLLDILRAPVQGKVDDEAEDEAILRRNAVVALGDIGDPAVLPVLRTLAVSAREYQSVRDLARIIANKLETR